MVTDQPSHKHGWALFVSTYILPRRECSRSAPTVFTEPAATKRLLHPSVVDSSTATFAGSFALALTAGGSVSAVLEGISVETSVPRLPHHVMDHPYAGAVLLIVGIFLLTLAYLGPSGRTPFFLSWHASPSERR